MYIVRKWRVIKGILNSDHPIRGLAERVLVRTQLCTLFTFHMASLKFRFFPAGILAQLWTNRSYYNHQLDFYHRMVKENDVVIDVGANVGLMTLTMASRVGAFGKLYAIEANPRVFRYLSHNVNLNRFSQVKLFHAAAGDHEGTVRFVDHDAMSFVQEEASHTTPSCTVPMLTLDSMIPQNAAIELLKVDVEGYELHVFRGAIETLKRTQVVIFEVSNDEDHSRRYGYQSVELLSFMESFGFSLYGFASDERKALIHVSPETPIPCPLDIIAVRDVKKFMARTFYPLVPE